MKTATAMLVFVVRESAVAIVLVTVAQVAVDKVWSALRCGALIARRRKRFGEASSTLTTSVRSNSN